ncbi:hypothetical protein ANCCAN_21768 [Ancylostoma caninum]|uniref:Uncharacterized protein n=1 Tax=Ancylostoma caninum TaxID=29170 RepID=A0A368FJJ8_ANCCA|nr:hypothetical protein ANCCAN_21768 [Ancylostoma caninum]
MHAHWRKPAATLFLLYGRNMSGLFHKLEYSEEI